MNTRSAPPSSLAKLLLQHSRERFFAFDADLRLTEWSAGMAEWSGLAEAVVVGQVAAEVLAPLGLEVLPSLVRCLNGSAGTEFPQSMGRHGGRDLCLEWVPLPEEAGRPQGGLAFLRDAEPASDASGSSLPNVADDKRLRQVMDAVPALISFVDRDRRYRLVSRAYVEWLGWPREELLNRPIAELVGEETWNAVRPYLDRAFAGEVTGYEQYLRMGNRVPRWYSTTYIPQRDATGSVEGVVVLVYDVTEQKEAAERFRITSEASRILGATLDYDVTLQEIARLALPHLADFCYVDVVENGEIRRIAAAHSDPEQESALRELQENYPPTWDSPAPAARVLRSRASELLPVVDETVATSHTRDARHLDLIRRLRIRSHIAVPLVSRGELVGAISLALTGSERQYGPADLELAEELARRAASAIDHARLHRSAQVELTERRRAEERLKLRSQVLESMREGVSVSDEEGFIVYTNPAEDAMFGYERGELISQHVSVQNDYPPEENQRIVDGVIQTLRRDGVWIGEWRNRKKDGTPFTTRAQITALDLAGRQYWVCVQEDVTAQRQADERLRLSEERYRSLVAATASVVLTADPEGRFVEPQDSWQAYTGQSWEQHQGWGWLEAIHPEERDRFLSSLRASMRTRGRLEAHGRVWMEAAGTYRHFIARAVPLHHADGMVREWVGTLTDVEEQVRAESSLSEETRAVETINRIGQVLAGELDLQALLQALTDAATEISDAQFGSFFYTQTNERGELMMLYTLSGAPQEAFANFPMPRFTGVFAPTLADGHLIRTDDILQDPRYGTFEPYRGMPPGHLPVRSYLAVPVISRTGEILGALLFGHSEPGVFKERHERILVGIAAQAAIAIDNARLYQQAREAERAARERADELALEHQRKDEFLAMLAHELRNPLGAFSNALHVMGHATPDRESFQRAQAIALRQVDHQTRLVDDLLDVSRIARGKIRLHREPLDLRELVQETVDDHRPAFQNSGVQLALSLPSSPVVAEVDRVRLAQVLGNLLDNARKFTPPQGPADGTVAVELSLDEESATAVLCVRDSGVGIDPDVIPSLFAPFAQADRTLDRSQGGLGLGLALVKGLVELHPGGSVEVHSQGVGHGTQFLVRLPARPAATARAPVIAPAEAPITARVLVIEDNPDAAETLRDLLELFGCEAEAALSGADGIQRARDFQPDVVLCDIGLPGELSGYGVAEKLRAEWGHACPYLIALTGYGTDEDKRRAHAAGFHVHLTKPVQPERLRDLLAQLSHRLATEHAAPLP